jgi:ADP-ribose pyrophosphatase
MFSSWQASYLYKDFEIISEDVKYEGHFKVLIQNLRFRMFAGGWSQVIKRERVIIEAAVAVLLYHPAEDAVLLVEQFRPGAIKHENNIDSPWLLEPVAGIIEIGDTIEETAKREVEEESGCVVLDLIPICKYLVSPGISNEIVHVMCGRINNYDLSYTYGLISESEEIKIHILPVAKAFDLLENNKIIAASSIIALQWLKINIQNVRDRWENT